MNINRLVRAAAVLVLALAAPAVRASDDDPLFHAINPLAQRDDWGRLHQMPNVDETDYFPRWGSRVYYYFKSGHESLRDAADVAALQTDMRNRAYNHRPITRVL